MTISEKVFFLDGLLFGRLLPIYKERLRGPHLPFEHLEEELKRKPGWPPVGHCKNNDSKIGEYCITWFAIVVNFSDSDFQSHFLLFLIQK